MRRLSAMIAAAFWKPWPDGLALSRGGDGVGGGLLVAAQELEDQLAAREVVQQLGVANPRRHVGVLCEVVRPDAELAPAEAGQGGDDRERGGRGPRARPGGGQAREAGGEDRGGDDGQEVAVAVARHVGLLGQPEEGRGGREVAEPDGGEGRPPRERQKRGGAAAARPPPCSGRTTGPAGLKSIRVS